MESGSTPEGFKKSFNACSVTAIVLMMLLFITVALVLYGLSSRESTPFQPNQTMDSKPAQQGN